MTYSPADWPETLQMDVYVPAGEAARPGVLVVHGGGWKRRSPADMDRIAEQLAGSGFAVFNVAYRFAPAHRFPAQLHDLQQAMRWIRANAARFRTDPERIGAFGYSAGAHLAALLAVVDEGDALDTPWGGPETRLAAVVAGGTPADLRKWPDSPLVNGLIGGGLAEAEATWTAASPVTHVSSNDPPFFLYHGGVDRLVEPEQAELMKAALDAAGVHAELFVVPYHGHVSMFVFGGSAVRKGIRFLADELELSAE